MVQSLVPLPIPQDTPKRFERVAEADFFAGFVGAAGVADAEFIDTPAAAGDFGGHLRFNAEAVLLQVWQNLLDYLTTKDFVAGFHIGEVQVGEDVRQRCQEAVGGVVPEVEDTVRAGREESRTVDDVRAAFDDRLDEDRVLGRVVFEVGVLDHDDIAGCFRKTGSDRRAFALVLFVKNHDRVRVVFDPSKNIPRSVGRTIVDQDDLLPNRHGSYAAEEFFERMNFVIDGDHHRQRQVVGDWVDAQAASGRFTQQLDGVFYIGSVVGGIHDVFFKRQVGLSANGKRLTLGLF